MDKKRVTGIGGIFFKSKSPGQLAEWYSTHLGIPVGHEDDNQAAYGMFEWRDKDEPEKVASTVWAVFPQDTEYLGEGEMMVNYRVADLDALLTELEEKGVWIDPHREDQEFGRFAWIKDPAGNRIELWEPSE